MAALTFLSGTSADYAGLASRDENTFYYLTDTNRIMKGDALYGNQVYTVATKPTTGIVKGAIYVVTTGADTGSYYASTNAAAGLTAMAAGAIDYTIGVTAAGKNATNNLYQKYNVTQENSTATDKIIGTVEIPDLKIEELETPTSGSANTYQITYGKNAAVKIEVPDFKDKVVTAGSIVVVNASNKGKPIDASDAEKGNYPSAEGTYLQLTIANQKAPIFINVQDLVDVYTGTAESDKNKGGIDVTVDENNKISAQLTWGTIA